MKTVPLTCADGGLEIRVLAGGWTEVWLRDPMPRKLGADAFYLVVSRMAAAFAGPGVLRPISFEGVDCEAALNLSEGHASMGVEHQADATIIHILDSTGPHWIGHLRFGREEILRARAEIFSLIAWSYPLDLWRDA